MQTFYFNTGVKPWNNTYLAPGDKFINNERHIPFDCEDVPKGTAFAFAAPTNDVPGNYIIREMHNTTMLSKYAYFIPSREHTMTTPLPASISTIEEAKFFLKALYDNGEVFHPEDNAHDLADNPFTFEEGEQLNALMAQIHDLKEFDPCLFILHLDPDYRMD